MKEYMVIRNNYLDESPEEEGGGGATVVVEFGIGEVYYIPAQLINEASDKEIQDYITAQMALTLNDVIKDFAENGDEGEIKVDLFNKDIIEELTVDSDSEDGC